MSALALIVAATLAQAGTLRSDLALRGGGAGRSVVALSAWDKGGSQDWGAGIPTPTIDCAAVGTSSSASLQCSGATPSFAGPGQTAAGSPWWYRGDSAVRPSIALNGSTDWWNLGNQPTCGDKQTILIEFIPSTISGAEYLFGIDDRSAKRDFALYRNAGAIVPTWFKSGGLTEQIVSGIVAGSAFTFAASYDASGGDGAGVLRSNLNGTAPSPVTTGVAPLRNLTDQPMGIGASIGGAPLPSSSKIRRAARWCGWAGSAAELAQLVATQWGLAHDKPAGTVATHARTDSTPCGPFSDSELYWLGPGAPCIHAPTYAGWASGGAVAGGIEVYGAGANALTYSEALENAAWVKSAGVSAADASAACPLGPTGVRMSLVTTDSDADQIAQDAATTPGRSVWMARATGDAACGIAFADADGTGAQSVPLTDAPVRYWSGGTGQTGLSVARPAGGCTRWCMWAAQAQAVTYPVPYRTVAAGTPYSGAASTATTVTVPVALTDPARWAISVTATLATWSAQRQFLMSLGSGANSASIDVYSDAKIYGYVYDSSGVGRTITGGSHGFAPYTTHRVMMSVAAAPDALIWFDSVPAASTAVGAGTGIMSAMPASMAVGSTGSALHVSGLVSRAVQCKRAGGCR